MELLEGIKCRCDALGVAYPEMAVVDNCCHVRGDIQKVFKDIDVALDIWHFMKRYVAGRLFTNILLIYLSLLGTSQLFLAEPKTLIRVRLQTILSTQCF